MHTTTELFHLLSLICCTHSMSIGGGKSTALNSAVDAAVTAVCGRVWGGVWIAVCTFPYAMLL